MPRGGINESLYSWVSVDSLYNEDLAQILPLFCNSKQVVESRTETSSKGSLSNSNSDTNQGLHNTNMKSNISALPPETRHVSVNSQPLR